MEIKLSEPFEKFGCEFRIIETDNGYELQRLLPSLFLNDCKFWKFVKDAPTLQELIEYIEDLGNLFFNYPLSANTAFLLIDACILYESDDTLSDDKKMKLRLIINQLQNNITFPTED